MFSQRIAASKYCGHMCCPAPCLAIHHPPSPPTSLSSCYGDHPAMVPSVAADAREHPSASPAVLCCSSALGTHDTLKGRFTWGMTPCVFITTVVCLQSPSNIPATCNLHTCVVLMCKLIPPRISAVKALALQSLKPDLLQSYRLLTTSPLPGHLLQRHPHKPQLCRWMRRC